MEHDKSLRNIIDSAKTNQIGIEDVLAFARKNTLQQVDELRLIQAAESNKKFMVPEL